MLLELFLSECEKGGIYIYICHLTYMLQVLNVLERCSCGRRTQGAFYVESGGKEDLCCLSNAMYVETCVLSILYLLLGPHIASVYWLDCIVVIYVFVDHSIQFAD